MSTYILVLIDQSFQYLLLLPSPQHLQSSYRVSLLDWPVENSHDGTQKLHAVLPENTVEREVESIDPFVDVHLLIHPGIDDSLSIRWARC